MTDITYQLEPQLTPAEFIDILVRSTLAERRPVDKRETIAGMLAKADVILTARDESGLLIGVSRAITDFSYCTYLSDLAVDEAYQGRGIGRELIRPHARSGGIMYDADSALRSQGENLLPTHRHEAT